MQEDKKGYIKVYRKIEDWKYFRDPYVLQVFIFCLLHCEYAKGENLEENHKSGSFETTKSEMANILDMGRPKLDKCLNILKSDKAIEVERNGKITTIRVLKYDLYQTILSQKFSNEV